MISKIAALEFKLLEMERNLSRDIQEALGTPGEQMERLERLFERSAHPTKDAVFVKFWENKK